ncbi:MAG: hypothetical protein NC200_02835 [Candidatus Gastranaerophilales bacterium]|nr:hypothetical protein [Candidatus Gastranaerophilales bacterium]
MSIKVNLTENNSTSEQTTLSSATINSLKELGIDINSVNSESEAQSIIKIKQSETKFQDMTEQDATVENKNSNTTESYIISNAKKLAEELGITISEKDSFNDINRSIAKNLKNYIKHYSSSPMALEKAKRYQIRLSKLTKQYSNIAELNSKMLEALNSQADNNKAILGLNK